MKRIIFLFSLVILAGCSSETDLLAAIDNYNYLDYLPSEPGTELEYVTYSSESNNEIITTDYLNNIEQSDETENGISIFTYDFSRTIVFSDDTSQSINEELLIEASQNAVFKFNNASERAILKKKTEWEIDSESYAEVIETDASISTKAGDFKDCIGLLITNNINNSKLKKYYCPKVGEAISYIALDDSEFQLFQELTNISFPSEESSSDNLDNTESEPIEQIDENYSISPIDNAVSGRLPSKTNKSSSINVNDYMKSASEASMESIGTYLFHRPSSFEEDGTDQIWHYDYDYELSVRLDKDLFLKEVYFESTNGTGEEEFLIARLLLIALDKTIEETVNDEILFSGKKGATYTVGEYEVGIEFSSNSFKLLSVVK